MPELLSYEELNISGFTIKYLIIIFIIFNVKYDYLIMTKMPLLNSDMCMK